MQCVILGSNELYALEDKVNAWLEKNKDAKIKNIVQSSHASKYTAISIFYE